LAVKIGGGYNHRFGLYDAILIKDNHIQANGGIENTLNICRDYILHHHINLPIIVEVKNLSEFNLAKQFEMIDRILLDNFSPAEINETLPHNSTHKKIEISGGITEENIHEYLIKGIDLISMGDLTHHVSSVDISLKII
jgi:nicotinate-nucleotide pyrophosphorylase (carboxylating)